MINLLLSTRIHYTGFLFLGLLYAIFQTQNAMIDSWYYASCIKYGRELLNSHHLIFNLIAYGWLHLLQLIYPGTEAIIALNLMNAVVATGCLFVLYSCLLKLNCEKHVAFWLTCLAGVSFGFMRFATDAETYILPLLASLIATRFFVSDRTPANMLLAGISAAIAILIHQLHIWWATAMFVFLLRQRPFQLKPLLLFILPLFYVPLIYFIAYRRMDIEGLTFLGFVTGEYSKGNAGLDISLPAFLLTLINGFRSFLQVHGNIAILISKFQILYTIVLLLCGSLLFLLIKNIRNNSRPPVRKDSSAYSALFLTAFLLHLIFAYLSSGNAEFMVMLPFLAVLFIGSKYKLTGYSAVRSLVILMMVWNLSFAIIPNALLNIYKKDTQAETMHRYPDACFLWSNKPLVENVFNYRYGFDTKPQLIVPKSLRQTELDSLLQQGQLIYTDLPNRLQVYSREALLTGTGALKIINQYNIERVDSFNTLYGKNYIYLIR